MAKPINYQLVGYPYAGKTTLVKKLVKELGFAHISLDDLKWGRGVIPM